MSKTLVQRRRSNTSSTHPKTDQEIMVDQPFPLSEEITLAPNNKIPSIIRILKKATCPKLSQRGQGQLTYHLGYLPSSKTTPEQVMIRITANSASGFFSHEWIALKKIIELLEEITKSEITDTKDGKTKNNESVRSSTTFKATCLKDLFIKRGANNHGFLAAALKAEGLLQSDPDNPFLLSLNPDRSEIEKAIQALIDTGTDLPDEVAEAERIKTQQQADRIAKMHALKKLSSR